MFLKRENENMHRRLNELTHHIYRLEDKGLMDNKGFHAYTNQERDKRLRDPFKTEHERADRELKQKQMNDIIAAAKAKKDAGGNKECHKISLKF